MEFHDLEVFITVAKQKSFSKTAKIMLRTQPAISLSIRRLEDEIGEKLFDRSSKEPILTYEGEVLHDYAIKLLSIKKDAFRTLQELKSLHRGHLKIGANEIGSLALREAIIAFHQRYPNIFIDVIRYGARDILHALSEREIDFGVMSYADRDPAYSYRVLFEDHMCCVAHPAHSLAQNASTYSIKRLERERFVAHQTRSLNKTRIKKLFVDHNVSLNVDIQLPSIEAIKTIVIQGHALAILPLISVQDDLESKRLVQIHIKEIKKLDYNRNIELTYPKKGKLSHSAQAFLDLMALPEDKPEKQATKAK